MYYNNTSEPLFEQFELENKEAGGGGNIKHFPLPKYVQAILTILICILIMSTTLCFILRTKYWCNRCKNRLFQSERYGGSYAMSLSEAGVGISSPRHERRNDIPFVTITRDSQSSTSTLNNHFINENNDPISPPTSLNYLSPPPSSTRFQRRMTFGPFGDDAIEFAHSTYKKPTKSPTSTAYGKKQTTKEIFLSLKATSTKFPHHSSGTIV